MTRAEPENHAQEIRKHIFVINGAPAFLNLMRDLFQDERFNVGTTRLAGGPALRVFSRWLASGIRPRQAIQDRHDLHDRRVDRGQVAGDVADFRGRE